MKVIRIFNAQPEKIPPFKSLQTRRQARWLHIVIAFFFIVHVMNVDYAKFLKQVDSRAISRELPLKTFHSPNFISKRFPRFLEGILFFT